ncbi:MAG: hypothetical protein HYU74_06290 [Dechloromonas sp.]|nr:hypothetical protein [Dechloromonas sp.]
MEKRLEMAQLLARFKLQVKRTLGETVDLERLTREPDYARTRLAEIEEAALDEDLLVMMLRLRDRLLPAAITAEIPATAETTLAASPEALPARETRSYLMGARAW